MSAQDSGTGSLTARPRRERLRHLVGRNVIWNWAGMIVEIAAGFFVAPYLVRHLGVTSYGLWIVIGSLSGYFSLLDLGLRGSVGRQLAYHRASQDWEGANRILNTALTMFSGIAVITLMATVGAVGLFHKVFEVPPDQLGNARIALLLIGVNLALSFPLQVFDGYLWAAQRFDLLNIVDIPASVLRVVLTFALVRNPDHIVLLAVITLLTQAGSGVVKGIVSFQLDPFLHLQFSHVGREVGKGLFGYGLWNFLLTVARLTKTQLSPVMIGSFLGIAVVTPFSIARRLQDYAHKVLWTATGVIVPIATGFHARAEREQQQWLFIEGGKYSATVAIFLVSYLVCLGDTLIGLWMGRQFIYAAVFLIILSLGELVQMTQSLTGSIILATARHKALAWMALAETGVSMIVIALVAKPFGLVGICLGLAVPQVIFSGFGTLIYGCKVTGVSIPRYATRALLPAVGAAIIPIIMLASARAWKAPTNWLALFIYSTGYTVVYAASCWFVLRPAIAGQTMADLKAALFQA